MWDLEKEDVFLAESCRGYCCVAADVVAVDDVALNYLVPKKVVRLSPLPVASRDD